MATTQNLRILAPKIRIEAESESVVLGKEAKVSIFQGEKLLAQIGAKIESQQGADGDYYPAVVLTKMVG